MARARTDSSRLQRVKRNRIWTRLYYTISLLLIVGMTFYIISYNGHTRQISREEQPQKQVDNEVPQESGSGQEPTKGSIENTPNVTSQPTIEPTTVPTTVATTVPIDRKNDIHLTFVGDILLADTVEKLLLQQGFDYPYKDVSPFLQKADITVANLETPVTDRGVKQTKEYVYRTSPKALPALLASGVDILNLANNHSMDYGEQGLLDTFYYLDNAGFKHIGAGKDRTEAFKPVIVEKNGIKVAFLGFSRVVPDISWKAGVNHPGVADTYNYTVPVETIKAVKAQADLVVVIAHWGVERTDIPAAYQTELAHRFIDAGADLVVASHPHVLQGFESYNGKWIAYSLGNFIFTTNSTAKTWETAILDASCSRAGDCQLGVVPVWTKWAKPTPMDAIDGGKLFQRLTDISIHAQVMPDGTVKAK